MPRQQRSTNQTLLATRRKADLARIQVFIEEAGKLLFEASHLAIKLGEDDLAHETDAHAIQLARTVASWFSS